MIFSGKSPNPFRILLWGFISGFSFLLAIFCALIISLTYWLSTIREVGHFSPTLGFFDSKTFMYFSLGFDVFIGICLGIMGLVMGYKEAKKAKAMIEGLKMSERQ